MAKFLSWQGLEEYTGLIKTFVNNLHNDLIGKINEKADSSHTHPISNITNLKSSLDGKSDVGHTHNYAGSSSVGGAATSANKLNTNAGSGTQPVYFANGVPVATTYSLGKSVPSDAKFTDTTYSVATTEANGLMGADDKKKIGSVTGTTYTFGAMGSKTITDLRNALDHWLNLYSSTANATAIFSADTSWITAWNSGDTSTTLKAGVQWTVTNIATYSTKAYTQLRISTYGSKHIYYVTRENGTWGNVSKTAFKEDLDLKQDKLSFTANRAIVSDANGKPVVSATTSNEIWYLSGAKSNIQTQLDGKASTAAATTSANGLMTSAMVTKLNGIATGANAYTHPTTSGNKHIPAGGSSGQILRWSADGTAVWGADNNTTYSQATSSALGLVKIGYTASGKNYPVQLNSSGQMYVNVPWTDNNTTYTLGSFGITATAAQLNYCSGVTSNIQTQLDGKLSTSGTAAKANSVKGKLTVDVSYGASGGATSLIYDGSKDMNLSISASPLDHTHNYAASSSAGGDAKKAEVLSQFYLDSSGSATSGYWNPYTYGVGTWGAVAGTYAIYDSEGTGFNGIFSIKCRCGADGAALDGSLSWLTANSTTPPVLTITHSYDSTNKRTTFRLYITVGGGWRSYKLTKISEVGGSNCTISSSIVTSMTGTTFLTASSLAVSGGGASGNYLPLSGGAVTGRIWNLHGSYTSTAAHRFGSSALEIRENGLVANAQTDIGYAPSIGFHWSGLCAGTLVLDSSGRFQFVNQAGGNADLAAANIYENGATLSSKYAPLSHTHDDRYYTGSQVDAKLAGKATLNQVVTFAGVSLGNGNPYIYTENNNINFRWYWNNTWRYYSMEDIYNKLVAGGAITHGYLTLQNDAITSSTNSVSLRRNGSSTDGFMVAGNCRPLADNSMTSGSSSYRWKQLYAATTTINTSDRNAKRDFRTFDSNENYEKFFMDLKPLVFKFKDGESKRDHFGFVSQDVEDSLYKYNFDDKSFAGFCKDVKVEYIEDEDGNGEEIPVLDENGNEQYIYGLRYSEFTALNTYMIQKVVKENQEFKVEIAELKEENRKLITEIKNILAELKG